MRYRDRKLAAEYIRSIGVPMSAQRLADLASENEGPTYVIINGRALYTDADLDAWIAAQAARPLARRTSRSRATAV